VAGAGLVGAGTWVTLANGPWWIALVMAIVFVLFAAAQALSVIMQAVIPQNSGDRLTWSQTLLDYRLALRRDRASVKLAQTWIGGLAALPPQAVIEDGPPSTHQDRVGGAAGRDARSP
jgi:hypothetical protein